MRSGASSFGSHEGGVQVRGDLRPQDGTGRSGVDVDADVVVVGAGLSGLVASVLLSRAGRRVRCLEARDRVGGRALTVDTPHGPVDLGATWFWPGEHRVAALARQLDVPTFPQHLAGDALLEQPLGPLLDGPGPQRVSGNPVDVPSSRFGDGAQDLVRRLAAGLPAGVLQCDSPVVGVAEHAGGVVVTTRGPDGGHSTVTARTAVIALPPALAVSIVDFADGLDPAVADVAARTAVWMGDVVKAVAVYETPFWREVGLAGAGVSYRGPFREFHDMSRADGATPALFGFAPAAAFSDADLEQVRSAFVDQLVRVFGPSAGRPASVHVKNWARERWTVPAAPVTSRTVPFGHPVLGRENPSVRILWCSTETAEVAAGHLEGAIDAAARAARAILGHP